MTRYDRYAIGQMTAAFGALALVLAAIYWVNRAVILFDRLIADGQGFAVFIEFTALSLPEVLRLIVPMAAFAAAVMVASRLRSDNELSVLRAAGASSWRIARPALAFGLVAALAMSALVHVLAPAARERLALRGDEIAADATAGLLTEGAFLHPAEGVTFYLRALDADGTLADVFLSDARDPANATIYTASRARLVRGPGGTARLVMIEGLAQTMRTGADGRARLFATRFDDFSYDLGRLGGGGGARDPRPREMTTRALLDAPLPRSEIAHELARRSAEPVQAVAAALLGFCALLMGQHARTRRWWQVAVALLGIVAMKALEGALIGPAKDDPRLWWMQFVAPLLAILGAGAMLMAADRAAGPRAGPARGAAA